MMRRSFECLGWAKLKKRETKANWSVLVDSPNQRIRFIFLCEIYALQIYLCFFPDPRVRDWLFMANPFPMFGILAVYLYFILKWGPAFMKNRKPFNLNKIIIAYNIIQIVACARLVVQVNPFYIIQIFLFYHKYDVRFFSSVYTQRTVLA